MAWGGMRISDVLQLTQSDVEDQKLTLRSSKTGKEREGIFGRVFFPLPDIMFDRDWGRFFAVFTLALWKMRS
jgi:integrase